MLRFNACGPDGLVDGKSPGAPSKLNADHRRALAEVVEAGPVPAVDGVVRWRRKDLARWLFETFAISLDETTVGRELKALGFAKISARPRHYAQNELAVEAFKKNFPAERECQKICARAVLSDIDEPFAEDDGELCFGLVPFPRRTFPRLGRMIENEI